jgi:hypothetical protein
MSRFSPIDIPWVDPDPGAPNCWCPDSFIDNCIPVWYCPQHGERPDFSLAGDEQTAAAWRAWRLESGWKEPG